MSPLSHPVVVRPTERMDARGAERRIAKWHMVYGDGHITESAAGYLRVDFRSCSSAELSEVYRAFAVLCIDTHATGALLKAGDDYAPGHYGVRDALKAMATRAMIPNNFKLALIPSTRSIEAVYRETQQHLRAAGFNAWVFRSENEAVDWLEGRATAGETAS
jgi:hypothetical protein